MVKYLWVTRKVSVQTSGDASKRKQDTPMLWHFQIPKSVCQGAGQNSTARREQRGPPTGEQGPRSSALEARFQLSRSPGREITAEVCYPP